MKKQAIWGQIFCTAAEVKAAFCDFVARYNADSRMEQLDYLIPLDYRNRHLRPESLAA
ncbi:IS3 family transposase [Skermanella mucosa]|uniref:IS3 family transposase n=1 Tax=Skermanella mucosa TaxID=1789672 RepID=UPI00192BB300|nr:IS3 family transposase [Skermanella mucosa]UEM21370.1 IS3 family transposase [Skermanella mucosa]